MLANLRNQYPGTLIKTYMKHHIFKLFSILSIILIVGCSGNVQNARTMPEKRPTNPDLPPRVNIDYRAYEHYVNGTIFESLGDYYQAGREYARALDIIPRSNEIRYSYANVLKNLKDYRGAISNAKKIEPRDADTWVLLGDSYRALGKFDSSLASYTEAVKLDSQLVNAYYFIGAFYQQLNNLDSAIWAYEHVAKLTENYQAYLQLANMQLQAGEIDAARDNYLHSIELDSSAENVRSYLGLSAIYEEAGDLEKGKYYMEMAAERKPDDPLILNRLMNFYQDDREYGKALDIAKQLWDIGPADYGIARRMGVLYFNLDSLNKADSIFNDLIDRGDSHIINQYYAGQTAFQLGDLEKAKNHFAQLTVVADSVVDGWMNLGMIYDKQDSLQTEAAVYKKALNYMRTPEDSLIVLFSLGATLEKLKNFDEAVAAFEKVLEIKPDHAPSLNYLGYMLAEKGIKLDYAQGLIEKALKSNPNNGAYLDSYGWVLYQKGKYKEALDNLLKAYKEIDSDPTVLEHIGDTYSALGNREKAVEFWKKALEENPDNESVREKLSQ